jgi:hypothetical protein
MNRAKIPILRSRAFVRPFGLVALPHEGREPVPLPELVALKSSRVRILATANGPLLRRAVPFGYVSSNTYLYIKPEKDLKGSRHTMVDAQSNRVNRR